MLSPAYQEQAGQRPYPKGETDNCPKCERAGPARGNERGQRRERSIHRQRGSDQATGRLVVTEQSETGRDAENSRDCAHRRLASCDVTNTLFSRCRGSL